MYVSGLNFKEIYLSFTKLKKIKGGYEDLLSD